MEKSALCLVCAAAALFAGCGGSSSAVDARGTTTGTLTARDTETTTAVDVQPTATVTSTATESAADAGSAADAVETSSSTAVDAAPVPASGDPMGWATRYVDETITQPTAVTGGAGAPANNIYVVKNRQQLRDALENKNSSTADATAKKKEPKIIYVVGTIRGNELADGSLASPDTYRAGPTANQYDFDLYVKSFDTAYKTSLQTKADAGDTAAADELKLLNSQPGTARTSFSNNQKSQIQFQVPPNTSLLGVGQDAKMVDGYLSLNTLNPNMGGVVNSNIIIRNIEFQAPQDYAPAWDPSDTSTGAWNARYDAISIVTSRRIWIDHCTFSDGEHPDSAEPTPFSGKHVQRHDGLIDIEDGSDFITISYSVFRNHDKTMLIGSTGGGESGKENYETGRERITLYANLWDANVQRTPLARWGQFHVVRNVFRGNPGATEYALSYAIGMGTSSSIFSETNVFDFTGAASSVRTRAVNASGGKAFHDMGSWLADAAFSDLDAVAKQKLASISNTLDWTPPYPYSAGTSAASVRQDVTQNAGAGKLDIKAP